jgi:beta-phosphoglucomutase
MSLPMLPSGPIKAVLFDMDGVLIDARDWHYEALNRALGIFGMSIERDAHLATFDGLPTRRKLEILSASRGLPRGLHEFLNTLKQAHTLEIIHARCRPRFQHQYALAALKWAGYRLAVCSNSVRRSVEEMMRLASLDGYLDLQLSSEDVARAKPDPEIYTAAMARLGLRPAECLIVEDNEHGIQAARSSGAHVLVVETPDDVTLARIEEAIARAEAAPAMGRVA